jgi:ribulose-5-phosphate 4-epimerase/fuculose-1-phosphate aldolase
MTEGYIKFNCIWEQKDILIPEELYKTLEEERTRLYKLGLIGVYPDGIGFGNISVRTGEDSSFFISGSATGQFRQLKPLHYALVNRFNLAENSIACSGQIKASSESMTHAAVYESLPDVRAVVHIHCLWLWSKLLNICPHTPAEIEYGTPEMALAVQKLASGFKSNDENIIVMGGHREGILAFGSNLHEATTQIINIYNQYKND